MIVTNIYMENNTNEYNIYMLHKKPNRNFDHENVIKPFCRVLLVSNRIVVKTDNQNGDMDSILFDLETKIADSF